MKLPLSEKKHWQSIICILLGFGTAYAGTTYGWSAAFLGIWLSLATGFLPQCQWFGPIQCKTHQETIRITIDDGPDPFITPLLLDVLDRYKTKAIFFMIGELFTKLRIASLR